MKVILAGHIQQVSGTIGAVTYYTSSTGQVFARYNRPRTARERTADQQHTQEITSETARRWNDLTLEQQTSWQKYAAEHFLTSRTGRRVKPSGRNAFLRVNFFRLLLQLPLAYDAPQMPPPGSRVSIVPLEGQPDDTFSFRVHHRVGDTAGYRILVRVTEVTDNIRRKPQVSDLRYIFGISPDSARPLPPSGEVVVFAATRFSLPPGCRYGIEARIISPEGVAGDPTAREFVRA